MILIQHLLISQVTQKILCNVSKNQISMTKNFRSSLFSQPNEK